MKLVFHFLTDKEVKTQLEGEDNQEQNGRYRREVRTKRSGFFGNRNNVGWGAARSSPHR
jgi:hypothetical protein